MPPPPRSTLFPYTTLFRSIKESREGTEFSHASVMRPMGSVAERVLAIGIRSMNRDEAAFLRTRREVEVRARSEEHTSDSSHMSISYAVFCLKKKSKIKVEE